MKVGSIVECVCGKDEWYNVATGLKSTCPLPELGAIYTVDGIEVDPDTTYVILAEMPIDHSDGSPNFLDVECFRELLPPQPLEELIGDALTRPVKETRILTISQTLQLR